MGICRIKAVPAANCSDPVLLAPLLLLQQRFLIGMSGTTRSRCGSSFSPRSDRAKSPIDRHRSFACCGSGLAPPMTFAIGVGTRSASIGSGFRGGIGGGGFRSAAIGGFRGGAIRGGFGRVGIAGLGFRGPVVGRGVRVAGFRGGGWRRGWGWGGWGSQDSPGWATMATLTTHRTTLIRASLGTATPGSTSAIEGLEDRGSRRGPPANPGGSFAYMTANYSDARRGTPWARFRRWRNNWKAARPFSSQHTTSPSITVRWHRSEKSAGGGGLVSNHRLVLFTHASAD